MDIQPYHEIAARMLCNTETPDPNGLHVGIVVGLDAIHEYCVRAGGALTSRQIVAQFIAAWRGANPTAIPYLPRSERG